MSAKLADVLNIARQKGFHIPEPKIDIVINGRYLQDITADAMKRLDASNDPPYIFVRGNQLVRLLNDNGLKFDLLDESALRGLLARSSGFVRYEGQDDDDKPMYVKVPPPLNVVKDILSLGSWPNIPPIEGWSEPLRVDKKLSNADSWREVHEEDQAALRPGLQDISISRT